MTYPHKKLVLLILDGWGIAPEPQYSAIDQAQTPFIDSLYRQYPHCQLATSGPAVGLPEGQVGNSEVGHLNLGAGRVVEQSLVHINKAIAQGTFQNNGALLQAFAYVREHQKAIHLLGLVSDGGVHAHIDHLKALCSTAHAHRVERVFVHAFTDGRDTAPKSVLQFLEALESHLQATNGQLASITGRYYAMDRDQRWERTQLAYNALVQGQGVLIQQWRQAITQAYAQGTTDEFFKPMLLTDATGNPKALLQAGDVVICFNFRADRSRQLMQLLTQPAASQASACPPAFRGLTMTAYDDSWQDVQALFPSQSLSSTLGEVLSQHGKRQLRIAETEKYPHVTYFFSGGREAPFPGEERILCPSPRVATYDLAPAMAAHAITQQVLSVMTQQKVDFICLNFANADMVGHTGVWSATVQACEVVDRCVQQVVQKALMTNYATLIVADHGNAEKMYDHCRDIHTAHTDYPVPCIMAGCGSVMALRDGRLADVAPTVLHYMGLAAPKAMQGRSLIVG
ncbi:MAG: 2,3-bisphosphoglycerate-independent phosphoglycerate mutase [Bacteroidota bacterium]